MNTGVTNSATMASPASTPAHRLCNWSGTSDLLTQQHPGQGLLFDRPGMANLATNEREQLQRMIPHPQCLYTILSLSAISASRAAS